MKIRGLLISVIALALLGGGLWWSNKREKEKEGKPSADAPPNILTLAEDQFKQIEIARGGETTLLRKGDGDRWEIAAPQPLRADQDNVKSLVTTLSKLDSERLIEEKAADLSTYGLSSPSLLLTVTKKDGGVEKLMLGDETPTGSGVFAKLESRPAVYTMASWNKSSLDKSWKDLRDRKLLTFDSDKLSRLELTVKNQTVEFGKNNQNEWQIVRPRPMRADGGVVEELARKLKDAQMDTSASDEELKKAPAQFAAGTPVATARMTDAAGTQQMEVRQAKDGVYYARSSELEGIYKVLGDLGDGLNKKAEDFRNKKIFDFGWSEPSKVEVRDGGKTYTFEKKDDKWLSGGKQMDSTSVQNLIDKLRDLSATAFPDSGFTTPVLQLSVTSNEGKRVETVLICQAGAKWLAQREREPSVYEVEQSAVEEMRQAAADVKPPEPPKDDKKKGDSKKK